MASKIWDDGVDLLAWSAGTAEVADGERGFALSMAVCDNADCNCTIASLGARPARRDGSRAITEPTVRWADFDVERGAFVRGDEGLIRELEPAISTDQREILRQRFRRAKAYQVEVRLEHDLSHLDLEWLVPFDEMFPSAWDLMGIVDGCRYWIADMWCLKAGCGCKEMTIDVLEEDGASLSSMGTAVVSVKSWRIRELKGDALVERVWDDLLEEGATRKRLPERLRLVQKVVRKLHVRSAAR